MKVLQKGVTPDGVHIQINDWSKDFSFLAYGSEIAIYPTIKGERVRFCQDFKSNKQAREVFNDLVKGVKQFSDFDFYYMVGAVRFSYNEVF